MPGNVARHVVLVRNVYCYQNKSYSAIKNTFKTFGILVLACSTMVSTQEKLQVSGYALLVFVVCMAVCVGTIYGVNKKSLFDKYWADILFWVGLLVLYFLLTFASMYVFTVKES